MMRPLAQCDTTTYITLTTFLSRTYVVLLQHLGEPGPHLGGADGVEEDLNRIKLRLRRACSRPGRQGVDLQRH